MQETDDAKDRADLIMTNVIPLGQRFYPSESSFPLRSFLDLFSGRPLNLSYPPGFVATLLVRFTLANKDTLTPGWAARVLIQCGVRFAEIWDVFHEMYESQVINLIHPNSRKTQ
jgi:nuclear pore complex protein Nup155